MDQIIETINYKGRIGGFAVSLPRKESDKAILDLHGLGEKSWASLEFSESQVKEQVQNNLISKTGLPFLIKNGLDIDFIVISPQMWGSGWWDIYFVKAVHDYCKEKYKFKYCFGHGISAGGQGIGLYAEKYSNDIVATVSNAGVRSENPVKRIKTPHWDLSCSGDSTVSAKWNGLSYVDDLNKAGGQAFYTFFQGLGHNDNFWNATLDGTITEKQLDAGIEGNKVYKNDIFPIGNWFDGFVKKDKAPIVSGSHPNPEIMFQNSDRSQQPLGHYNIGWNNEPWFAEIEFQEEKDISKIYWYDAHGMGSFEIAFSKNGKEYSDPLTFGLNEYMVWKEKEVNVKAKFIKVSGKTTVVPIRVAFDNMSTLPKTYNIMIEGATEAERDGIIKMVGKKASIK